ESAAQRSARATGPTEKTVKPASSAANRALDRRAVMVLDSRAGRTFLLALDLPGNAGGGRFSASFGWLRFTRALFHSAGLSTMRLRISSSTLGSGIHMPAPTKHSPGSRWR